MFPITITLTSQAQLATVMAALGAAQPAVTTVEAKVEAPKQEAVKAEAAPTQAIAPVAAVPEAKAEVSAPTVAFEEVKKAFLALAGKQREVAVRILADHGCAKLTEAKPEQFAAIHAAIEKASA